MGVGGRRVHPRPRPTRRRPHPARRARRRSRPPGQPGTAPGDGYIIDGDLWVWTGTAWTNAGNVQGPPGPGPGRKGPPGRRRRTPPCPDRPARPARTVPGDRTRADRAHRAAVGAPGASVRIVGEVATVGALPAPGSVAVGDSYIVTADGDLYTSTGTAWLDVGQIVGPQGPTGATGPTGPASRTVPGRPGRPVHKANLVSPVSPAAARCKACGGGSPPPPPPRSPPARSAVNHDSPASATVVWLSKTSDQLAIDFSGTIDDLKAGDHLYLQTKNDANSFHRYTITGTPTASGTSWQIPVVTDSGSPAGTEPPTNAEVVVVFQFFVPPAAHRGRPPRRPGGRPDPVVGDRVERPGRSDPVVERVRVG